MGVEPIILSLTFRICTTSGAIVLPYAAVAMMHWNWVSGPPQTPGGGATPNICWIIVNVPSPANVTVVVEDPELATETPPDVCHPLSGSPPG